MTNFRNHDNLIADGDTRGARRAAGSLIQRSKR